MSKTHNEARTEREENTRKICAVLGQEMKNMRKNLGFTIDEIAEIAGTTRWNVYHFESGCANSATILSAYIVLLAEAEPLVDLRMIASELFTALNTVRVEKRKSEIHMEEYVNGSYD